MHPEAVFYVNLLARPEVRNHIKNANECQELIDQMEERIPHDQLPACYDWLISRRDLLQNRQAKAGQRTIHA